MNSWFTRAIAFSILSLFCTSLLHAQTTFIVGTGELYTTITAALAVSSPGDTIEIQDAVLTEHSITIDRNIVIRGQGADATIIQATSTAFSAINKRIFYINSDVTVTISGLQLQYGHSFSEGGAIMNLGTLTVDACTISENKASAGGGIMNIGTMTVTNSTFTGNVAGQGAGIANWIGGAATCINCTITGNNATSSGGGISSYGASTTTIVTNCTIANNTASTPIAGLYFANGATVIVKNSIIYNNTPINCSDALNSLGYNIESGTDCGCSNTGDMQNTDPLLSGLADNGGTTQTMALKTGSPAINPASSNGAPSTDQRGVTRIATADIGAYESSVVPPANLTVGTAQSYLTIADALTDANDGDTITVVDATHTESNITVDKNVIIRGTSAASTVVQGSTSINDNTGTIFTINAGKTVLIEKLHIRYGDAPSSSSGAILNNGILAIDKCHFSYNNGSYAGALFNNDSAYITNTTFAYNTSSVGGGGIYNENLAGMELISCTIVQNTGTFGGGIMSLGSLSLTNCTVTLNSATFLGGGIFQSGDTQVKNTIFSQNIPENCGNATIVSGGYNIDDSTSCGCTNTGDMENTDPQLSALAYNGGGVYTMSLLSTSPAINPFSSNDAPDTDQRGYPRTYTADIGAFEAYGVLPVELTSFSTQVVNNTVRLRWQTSTEVNNAGFEIQRNTTDRWESIGFVDGHGTTNSPQSYTYIDPSPIHTDKAIYRLRQIDRDGTEEFSNEIEVNFVMNATNVSLLENFPNPFNPATLIRYTVPHRTHVTLRVYNNHGTLVEESVNEEQDQGTYSIKFSADGLPSGTYFYELVTGTSRQIQRMLLVK